MTENIMKEKLKSITIAIGVKNSAEALNWYTLLLGDIEILEPMPGLYEMRLMDDVWLQLDDTGYLDTGGNSVIIRFETDNIEAAHKKALQLAVAVESIEVVEGVIKYFDFKDLSGNRLSYVELL